MRLLANENFPRQAVEALRAQGHDVAWIADGLAGTKDADVLALAVRENRLLVTQDKDFGELAFRSRLPATCGIVLFRVTPVPALVTEVALRVFFATADLRGKFVVVETNRVRERALPG